MGPRDDLTFYRNRNRSADVWSRYPEPKEVPRFLEGPLVLDAGCGNGRNLPLLSTRGFEAVGLEINDDLVRMASSGGEVVQASITSIPFRDGTFDTSIVGGVLWYVKDIRAAHSEMLRVCKKHYTWSYTKFFNASLLKPRSFLYFVRSLLLGRIYPRTRETLSEFGTIVDEDSDGYLFLSRRDRSPAR